MLHHANYSILNWRWSLQKFWQP